MLSSVGETYCFKGTFSNCYAPKYRDSHLYRTAGAEGGHIFVAYGKTFLLRILSFAEGNLFSFQMTCTISLECGTMFFTNATKLRRIEIIRIQGLSDDILASWLKRNPLQLLEVVIQAVL